jgi:hypothetical protein
MKPQVGIKPEIRMRAEIRPAPKNPVSCPKLRLDDLTCEKPKVSEKKLNAAKSTLI